MRHGRFGQKLGRDTNSRKALLINLTSDLILRGSLKTTQAKAKFVQNYAEKVITSAKKAKLGKRRVVASSLTRASFKRLVEEIAPGFSKRNGGFTRITKLSPRVGDNAAMAKIELVAWDTSRALLKSLKKEKLKKLSAKPAEKAVKKNKTVKNRIVNKKTQVPKKDAKK